MSTISESINELHRIANEAAWDQFKRMPSSNPGDYGFHAVQGIRPTLEALYAIAEAAAAYLPNAYSSEKFHALAIAVEALNPQNQTEEQQ